MFVKISFNLFNRFAFSRFVNVVGFFFKLKVFSAYNESFSIPGFKQYVENDRHKPTFFNPLWAGFEKSQILTEHEHG